MGYKSYDKHWFGRQTEMIAELLHLAETHSESIYQYDDLRTLETDRAFVRDIRAGIEFHYPHHADKIRKLRTWKEIDRNTGAFYLHVGTENNYKAQPRALKSTGGRMTSEGRLRGSRPGRSSTIRAAVDNEMWYVDKPGLVSNARLPEVAAAIADEKEVFRWLPENDGERFTVANLDALALSIQLLDTTYTDMQLLVLEPCDLTIDEAKQIVDSIETWAYDSDEHTDGRVTKLTLRRRSQ